MEVANQDNPINTKYPNVDFSLDASKQLPQKTAEELKQQRENFRKETFFTPLPFTANKAMHNGNINNQHSEHLSIFDTLGTANFLKVKDIFIQEVNEFIKLTKYFAGNKYIKKLETLISRIQSEKEPEGESKLIDHLRCCVLSLHDLTVVLNNLESQLEQSTTSTKSIFSKDTITVYLDDCIVDLDKCWAGISSRFTHEYNTLSSLNNGILGRINIIKKELLDALLTEYFNAKKQEDPDLFIEGNEIHIRNALNNAMHEILGIHKIEDPLEDKSLNPLVKQEFIELATIEISPARITSMLADNFYQDLTMILDKYSMSSWLTEYKSIYEFPSEPLQELNSNFLSKINILFDARGKDELDLYSLLDIIETVKGDTYSFHLSREKLQQWIAKRLIPDPDAETVFIKDSHNDFTIQSTDYMFFSLSETADNNNHSDSKDYIRLQLSHIQNIDFINFTDVEEANKCYLSSHEEKTTTSISLVTQAMEQTDDALTVVKFILENATKLAEVPLLKTKVKNIINSKLLNDTFKNKFYGAVIEKIKNNYEFSTDEIYYLLNNSICNDFLIAIIKQKKTIDDLLENIDIKYLDDITSEILNEISTETKKSLFDKAVHANNCEIIYKLLCDSGIDAYNNITNNENLVTLAIKYNHIKLAELLLQDKTLNIKDYNLFDSFYHGHCEIISLCIKHILANKSRFNDDTFINHLQAKYEDGFPGLYAALQNGHEKTVTEYIKTILNTDKLTNEQKLKLIEAKIPKGFSGLFIALENGYEKTVTEYIKTILNTDKLTNEQKLKLIEAKSLNDCHGLYMALQKGHEKTVTEYIKAILNIDIDGVTIEQKLKLIEAKTEDGYPGLFVALYNGHEKTVTEYINVILNTDNFTDKQKLKLIKAKNKNDCPGLYVALQNGHEKTVTEYINVILNTDNFTDKQKLKLIKAKNKNDCTGLYVALQNGHEKAVTEYFKVIAASKKLTLEQKVVLFTNIRKKNLVLYTKLVNNSYLTLEEKNYLLTDNSSKCTIL